MIVSRDLEPYLHGQITRLFRDEGLTPRVAQEIGQLPILLSLVSEGVGVALVPDCVRKAGHVGVAYRGVRERTPPVDLFLAWRKDDESPVLRAFLDTFREVSQRNGKGIRPNPGTRPLRPPLRRASPYEGFR